MTLVLQLERAISAAPSWSATAPAQQRRSAVVLGSGLREAVLGSGRRAGLYRPQAKRGSESAPQGSGLCCPRVDNCGHLVDPEVDHP